MSISEPHLKHLTKTKISNQLNAFSRQRKKKNKVQKPAISSYKHPKARICSITAKTQRKSK
jgi:hypothetical protein